MGVGPSSPLLHRSSTTARTLAELAPGDVCVGVVKSASSLGVFVDVGVGTDGLLHSSQVVGSAPLAHGTLLQVVVLCVDTNRARLSLANWTAPGAPEPRDAPTAATTRNNFTECLAKLVFAKQQQEAPFPAAVAEHSDDDGVVEKENSLLTPKSVANAAAAAAARWAAGLAPPSAPATLRSGAHSATASTVPAVSSSRASAACALAGAKRPAPRVPSDSAATTTTTTAASYSSSSATSAASKRAKTGEGPAGGGGWASALGLVPAKRTKHSAEVPRTPVGAAKAPGPAATARPAAAKPAAFDCRHAHEHR